MCLKEPVMTRLNPKNFTAQSRLVRCRISGEVRDIRYQAARYTETSVVANLSFPLLLSFPRGRHWDGMVWEDTSLAVYRAPSMYG